MKALVQPDGRVAQVESEEFLVHPSLVWIEIPDGLEVKPEWHWDGSKFIDATPGQVMADPRVELKNLLIEKMVLVELKQPTTEIDSAIEAIKAKLK